MSTTYTCVGPEQILKQKSLARVRLSLSRHKKILTELADRKGFYIGKIYQEIVSGDTSEARPEIQKSIEDCYAGKYI